MTTFNVRRFGLKCLLTLILAGEGYPLTESSNNDKSSIEG